MTVGIERLASAGSGPGRLRACLRRDTRVIALGSAAQRGVAKTASRISATLLGGELADVMGAELRRALRFWEHEAAERPSVPTSRSTPLVPPPTRIGSRGGLEARTDGRRSRGPAMPGPGSAPRTRQTASEQERDGVDRAARALERIGRTAVRATSPASGDREMHDRPTASVDEATPGTARAPVSRDRVESPLSRALRGYWRARSSETHSDVRRIGNATAAARASRPDRAADLPADSPRQPLLREPLSHAVESVRGANAEPSASPRARGAAAFTDRSLDAGGPRTPGTPLAGRTIATDWLTGDLADQLAEVLRDQAIREGIDLT